ncbi:Eco57I restriction-modification methylase domain-containing protein [Pseudomonas corrugata]
MPDGGMDSVIGNPPYVRYSKLDNAQKLQIKLWEKNNELRLSRRSSLWVYFTFHALNFLKPGARMAWVLPVSLLSAQYAEELRQRFFSRFDRLAFFTLTERIFLSEGTEERALIVLADGFRLEDGRAHITSSYVDNIEELDLAVASWDAKAEKPLECAGTRNFGVVPNSVAGTLESLKTQTHVSLLGDICSVGIGLVTGTQSFS